METQLVRLDAPYNVIFDMKKRFGLHIATLIVVDEVTVGNGKKAETKLRSRSFPVVNRAFDLEGEAWMDSELKNCHRICRQGETISLYDLRKFMEFCDSKGDGHLDRLPMSFNIAMISYNIKLNLFESSTGKAISDFKVELLFDEGKKEVQRYLYDNASLVGEGACMVHTGSMSPFYFWSAFSTDKDKNNASIGDMIMLRDAYLNAFQFEGLKSITFTTNNQKYQWYVDKLNNTKSDLYG